MGTNYYWNELKDVCESCGHSDSVDIHIGKSSFGWCFGMHVHPDAGINSLDDWILRWSVEGSEIRDEYGDIVSPAEMLKVITERKCARPEWIHLGYLEANHAIDGPNNLMRHMIEAGHCVAHGAGTWDYLIGDFS